MNLLQIRIFIIAAVIIGSFVAGWKVNGWRNESEKAATERAVAKAVDAYRDSESRVATILETKLSELRANEKVIEHETIKLIDRPVYRNECIDADGLRLIERARRGDKADSGKPDGEVR